MRSGIARVLGFHSSVLGLSPNALVFLLIVAFDCILIFLYLRAPVARGPFFKYLFGRAHYYGELSQIVSECMGSKNVNAWQHPTFDAMRRRALRAGVEYSIISLFEARLFASRCRSHDISEEQIRNNLDAFDATDPVLLQDSQLLKGPYARRTSLRWQLDDVLFLAYRPRINVYCKSDERERRRGRLLKLDFDPSPVASEG
jgi:hypothetical protein